MMDPSDKEKDTEEWECMQCTFKNHPIDKKCEHCQSPRLIQLPNIPDELPVPEITNPYPEKEFTNTEAASAGAHIPKRKEVPPATESEEPPTSKDNENAENITEINPKTADETETNSTNWELEQNTDQGLNLSESQNSTENVQMPMNFDPNFNSRQNSSVLSDVSLNLYGGSESNSLPPAVTPGEGSDEKDDFLLPPLDDPQNGLPMDHNSDDVSGENGDDFLLPPLPGFENKSPPVPMTTDTGGAVDNDDDSDDFLLPPIPGFQVPKFTTTAPVFSPALNTQTTVVSSGHQSRIMRVDDFLEQSKIGFQGRDFKTSLSNHKSSEQNGITPMELSDSEKSEPVQTGLDQKTSSKIQNPNRIKPPQISSNSNFFNLTDENQTFEGTSLAPLEPILPQKGAGDYKPPQIGNMAPNPLLVGNAIFGNPHLFSSNLLNPYITTANTPQGPPGLPKPSIDLGDDIGLNRKFHETKPPLKKIKPAKTSKPLDLSAKRSRNQSQSSIDMNVFDDDNNSPPGHATEIASLRSATAVPAILPPGHIAPPADISEFDPFAPAKTDLVFQDNHFTQEATTSQTTTTVSSQGTTATMTSTTATTTTTVASGARRKTPRTQTHTTMTTQTQLYSGPGTSHGPPPLPMVTGGGDPTKWSCPLCTYANRFSAQYCEVCHDGRPPWYTGETMSPIMLPETASGSMVNDRILHQTDPSANRSKAFVDEWVCQHCTMSNQPNHTHCASCGKDRPQGFATGEVPAIATENVNLTPIAPIVQASITEPKQTSQQFRSLTSQQSISEEQLSSLVTSSVGSITGSRVESIAMEQLRRNQEKNALDVFKNIEVYCREADDKFVDDQFIPGIRSLVYANGHDENVRNAIWLRPHQINCGDENYQYRRWTVFCEEGPDSTDIQQGILGNCWFLSGLSVLVERQELLRKIFVTSEYNKFGVYMIRLCKDGVWQTVIIDDLLPCSTDGQLLYTQAKRKQLWVPLIEKALAKIHGCYEALQAGRSIEGLATLTGAPCESLQLVKGPDQIEPDPDLIWARLLSSKEAKFLMGASCGGANMDVDENMYNRVDLRVRHAYSVLDVRTERLDNHGTVNLLQLRNPWAQQSWSGAWSDNDYKWDENPRLRARLQPGRSYHGIFWISFDDMLRYFDSVDICKTSDTELAEIRTEGAFPDSGLVAPTSYFIQIYQSCEIDFSIFQQGSRSQEGSGRHPVDLCICVFRSSEQAASAPPGSQVFLGPLVACSRRQVKRHGSCFHFFEPGLYQVVTLAFNHWMSAFGIRAGTMGAAGAEHPKYVLALHSSRPISLSPFRAHTSLFADATIELVMKKGEKKDVRECATCYYLTRGWAGLIVVAENRHPTRFMQVVCDCIDSRNVVSTRGVLKTGDSVPPLHKQVLIVLTQLDGHSGFTITHKLVHRMGYPGLGDWSDINGNNDPPLTEDVKALHQPRPL